MRQVQLKLPNCGGKGEHHEDQTKSFRAEMLLTMVLSAIVPATAASHPMDGEGDSSCRALEGRLWSDTVVTSASMVPAQVLPGDDWRLKIEKAVASTDVVVVCLSDNSVDKEGFVQRELRYALERADEQPEGRTFIVPVRLGPCEVPHRLRQWQWVDYFAESGYERLVKALHERARKGR